MIPARKDTLVAIAVVVGLWLGVVLIAFCIAGCGHVARVATPISSSHSQLTATDYDAAETEFGGGPVLVPDAAVVTQERCQALLDRRDALVAVTASLGGLTGAGGLATVIPEDASRDMVLGFGITTVVLAAATTGMTVAIKSLSERFERDCNQVAAPVMVPMTPVVEHQGDTPVEVEVEASDAGV